MKSLDRLCKISAVSGFERLAFEEFSEIFSDYGLKAEIDDYGNIYAEKKAIGSDYNILIDVHSDEIGLIVTEILENGFVKFDTVGGIDPKNLLCQEVTIYGKEQIYGVIGAIPPHLKKENSKHPLIIDTGLKRTAEIAKIGDPIKLKSNFLKLQNSQLASSAMDNRAGLIAALMIAKKFKQNANLTIVAAAKEETGLQGAKLFSQDKKFDLAIVIDVTHGYFDGLCDYRAFPVGGGFTLCYGGVLQNSIVKRMIPFLKKEKYKYNVEVEPNNPGTNAFAYVGQGIPTVMLSIPLKYMHTTVETLSSKDIKNLVSFVCDFKWGAAHL